MIGSILAGALGALALIVYLLFRRLRQLSWQLTQLRVERDCERILHEIGIRGGSRPVVNEPPAVPVRRKGHLSLYLGGGVAAALARLRDTWHRRRATMVASGAAATIALGAAALLLVTNGGPGDDLGPTPPPPESVSSEPGTPGGRASSGSAPPPESSPAGSPPSGAGDVGMGPGASAVTSAPARRPARSVSAAPSRAAPSFALPSPSPPSPSLSEPTTPTPSASGGDATGRCLRVRALVELTLCLGV